MTLRWAAHPRLFKEPLKLAELVTISVLIKGDLLSNKSRTLSDTMEETKDRHRRYMRAIQHPIRRDILRAMEKGFTSMDELGKELGVDAKVLDWHLKSLEHGFCIERKGEGGSLCFVLTQEGRIVDYLDRKAKGGLPPLR